MRSDDAAAPRRFFESLSDESRYLRFFSGAVNVEQAGASATDVDYRGRYGLIATAGPDGAVVANGMYIKTADERAEVAFAVSDANQGHGLGTLLLGQLAETAEQAGTSVLEAVVLPENHQMIDVFRQSGFRVRTAVDPGQILVEFPTSFSLEAMERFERREKAAAVSAMRTFFEPRSVAVIGASRKRGTIGGELFHNLLSGGFPGPSSRSTGKPPWSNRFPPIVRCTTSFTRAFVVHRQSDGTTGLLVRERYAYRRPWSALLVEPVEVVSFVMTQRILRGIKHRAELNPQTG